MLEIVNQLDGFDSRGNIKVRPLACLFTDTHVRCNFKVIQSRS